MGKMWYFVLIILVGCIGNVYGDTDEKKVQLDLQQNLFSSVPAQTHGESASVTQQRLDQYGNLLLKPIATVTTKTNGLINPRIALLYESDAEDSGAKRTDGPKFKLAF